jgi:hypothetical protein
MITRIRLVLLAVMMAMLLGGAESVLADDHWHHGDMRRFHDYDERAWHGGHWFHGDYGGRSCWWWIVGGSWYFYPAPVYPYPDPYVPPVVVPAQPMPPSAPSPTYWYYCPNPPGYYPYTAACPTNWMLVPASPG